MDDGMTHQSTIRRAFRATRIVRLAQMLLLLALGVAFVAELLRRRYGI
jgi:hypothetical protein